MSIQAVSFGKQALTKKGTPYEKTNLGGKIGAAVGAGYATYAGVKTVKVLTIFSGESLIFKRILSRYFSPKSSRPVDFGGTRLK